MSRLPQMSDFTSFSPNIQEKMLFAMLEVLHRIEANTAASSTPILSDEAQPLLQAACPTQAKAAPFTAASKLELSDWMVAQNLVAEDSELAALFWHGDEDQAQAFVRFIALAAQWSQVTKVWDVLANRCKQEQRPADADELATLKHIVSVHNLIWQNRQASLEYMSTNVAYDFKKMERGNQIGETVIEIWLPLLRNAGGEVVKNILVATK